MSQARSPLVLKCPVCAAKFRGHANCPRCGTDLLPLMRLAGQAWKLRGDSRAALLRGDLPSALRLAAQAKRLHKV